MFKTAKETREIQNKANKRYRQYIKIKEEIEKLIFYSSNLGLGNCTFNLYNNTDNLYYLTKIHTELEQLGYNVNLIKNILEDKIELQINWDE